MKESPLEKLVEELRQLKSWKEVEERANKVLQTRDWYKQTHRRDERNHTIIKALELMAHIILHIEQGTCYNCDGDDNYKDHCPACGGTGIVYIDYSHLYDF